MIVTLRRFSRVAAALGGLLIFIGIVVMGIFVLALFHIIDIDFLMEADHQALLVWILLVIGVLDLASGILLAYER